MNINRHIAYAAVTVATLLVPFSQALAGAAPNSNQDVHKGRLFELSRGDVLTLAHRSSPTGYRVCVSDLPSVVPLDVLVDGKTIHVEDGQCKDVSGDRIVVEPSALLPEDVSLNVRFEMIPKK